MPNVDIISFTPDEAMPGESIDVKTVGIESAVEGEAIVQAAMWIPADDRGERTISYVVIIEDIDNYTQFSITLPEDMKAGKYELDMTVQIGTDTYFFRSGGITVSVSESDPGGDEPHMNMITPLEVSRDNLSNQTFTIRGVGLDQLTQIYITAPPSSIRLRVTSMSGSDSMRLKPITVASDIEPGQYRVKASILSGGVTYSSFRVNIT